MTPPTLSDLRRYAISRSLFKPTTLRRAIAKLGFVQADPIRAPARAQDLTLRHRVANYRAGDLERRYSSLPIEEDFFVNYGFVPREVHALMHPRTAQLVWTKARYRQANEVLDFIRERGVVHPREVDSHFAHGKATNWFGGSSNASTQLLDGMHYRGLLRIARREGGIRMYAPREVSVAPADPNATMDTLVDIIVNKYAPLTAASLSQLVVLLKFAVPHWVDARKSALARAKERLAHATVDGHTWYWPEGENPRSRRHVVNDQVRLLAPFDPVVWDRRRFELFWRWAYRFEAYTPAPKRVRGYYALPLLWRDAVVGWGNLSVVDGQLVASFGYANGRAPKDPTFRRERDAELARIETFLGLAVSS
ncbi:MAG TPA: crosslink repair DNA glycosylase YcaQ family protein [Steroidobacteraceae bacterium]|nr:crosslink repair DNA glycosylase YcaQ family protein [Steroidobacteraceae bacterium]